MSHKVWTADDLGIFLVGEAGFAKAQMLVGSLADAAETSGLPCVLGLSRQVQGNTGGPQSPHTHRSAATRHRQSQWPPGSPLPPEVCAPPFSTLPPQSGPLSAPGCTLRELPPARQSGGTWVRWSGWVRAEARRMAAGSQQSPLMTRQSQQDVSGLAVGGETHSGLRGVGGAGAPGTT